MAYWKGRGAVNYTGGSSKQTREGRWIVEWELKVKKLWNPWDRRTWGRNITLVSRAAFVACDSSRAVFPADDALSPFNFLAFSQITWHSLSNESPHLFTAPIHPSLLNTPFLQPQLPSCQPRCLLTLVLFFWPPLATGTCPCPLQLLEKGESTLGFWHGIEIALSEFSEKKAVLTFLPSLQLSVKQKRESKCMGLKTKLYLLKFSHNA